ncbi:hypothetical protein Trydic_g13217 [Trypoxylus dichotomus]
MKGGTGHRFTSQKKTAKVKGATKPLRMTLLLYLRNEIDFSPLQRSLNNLIFQEHQYLTQQLRGVLAPRLRERVEEVE